MSEITVEFSLNTNSNLKIYDSLKFELGATSTFITRLDNGLEVGYNSDTGFNLLFNFDFKLVFESNSNSKLILNSGIKSIFESVVSSNLEVYNSREILEEIPLSINFETDLLFKLISLEEVILILSPDLALLGYLENYNDFMWNRKWRKVDDFELSISRKKYVSRFLQLDNYIAVKQGDAVHAGRIKSRELKKDKDSENITVSGKGLGEIFENRIAFHNTQTGDGYDTFSGSAESAMKYYIKNNVVDPEDTSRMVSNLSIDTDTSKGTTINYNARFQKISEILYEIAKTTGLGWDIILDLNNKEFIFKVLSAKIKKEIRLNPEFDSVNMINFKEDKSESENTITIAGQGQGSERMIRTVSRDEVVD